MFYCVAIVRINGNSNTQVKGCMIAWEQEIYNQFIYYKDLPHFHQFPGDVSHYSYQLFCNIYTYYLCFIFVEIYGGAKFF